jgi:flagellar basal body-associated protein FliL
MSVSSEELEQAEARATKRLTSATHALVIATVALIVVTAMLVFKTGKETQESHHQEAPCTTAAVEH